MAFGLRRQARRGGGEKLGKIRKGSRTAYEFDRTCWRDMSEARSQLEGKNEKGFEIGRRKRRRGLALQQAGRADKRSRRNEEKRGASKRPDQVGTLRTSSVG